MVTFCWADCSRPNSNLCMSFFLASGKEVCDVVKDSCAPAARRRLLVVLGSVVRVEFVEKRRREVFC